MKLTEPLGAGGDQLVLLLGDATALVGGAFLRLLLLDDACVTGNLPQVLESLEARLLVVGIRDRTHRGKLANELMLHTDASLAARVQLGQDLPDHDELGRVLVLPYERCRNAGSDQQRLQRALVPEHCAAG